MISLALRSERNKINAVTASSKASHERKKLSAIFTALLPRNDNNSLHQTLYYPARLGV